MDEDTLNYYKARGVELARDEIYVGDGAKTDTACFSDLFDRDNVVAVADPIALEGMEISPLILLPIP